MTILNRRRLLQGRRRRGGPAAARQPGLRPGRAAQGRLHADRHAQRQWLELRPRQVGAEFMKEQLGDKVESTVVENVPEGPDCERVLRELAQSGHKLIFATSFGYGDYVIKVAQQFPDVNFEHATGYQRADNVGTYNARFHEGRAVCGTIAGHLSKTGKAGYIGSFPIPEVVMGINAFTLAARKINPAFTMTPVYISTWNDPGQGSRRGPRHDRPGHRRHRPAHRRSGGPAGRRGARRGGRLRAGRRHVGLRAERPADLDHRLVGPALRQDRPGSDRRHLDLERRVARPQGRRRGHRALRPEGDPGSRRPPPKPSSRARSMARSTSSPARSTTTPAPKRSRPA